MLKKGDVVNLPGTDIKTTINEIAGDVVHLMWFQKDRLCRATIPAPLFGGDSAT